MKQLSGQSRTKNSLILPLKKNIMEVSIYRCRKRWKDVFKTEGMVPFPIPDHHLLWKFALSLYLFDRESFNFLTSTRALNCPRGAQLWWYFKGQDTICNVGHIWQMNWFRSHRNNGTLLHEDLPLSTLVSFRYTENGCPEFHLLCALLWFRLRFQNDRKVGLLARRLLVR